MPRQKKIRSITVIGRRWFRRSAGNTYSSAQVIINGEPAAKLGPTGGYGDYYLQMAFEWLDSQGLINRKHHDNGMDEAPWSYCNDNGIALTYSAIDVARERDL